ncbi:MAG: hypothetical protein ABR508_01555 [Candidatus Baltobacteraceae bacterium]
MRERLDLLSYVRAVPVLGRNMGVVAAPLAGMLIVIALAWLNHPLFDQVGGAGDPITGLLANLAQGFAFGIAVIFADDAWRHGRGHLSSSWDGARSRAANILIASLGFFFLLYVAGMIGAILPVPYLALALQAIAVWAFIYAIPAAAIGGIPGGAVFSQSLQTARRNPVATALLVIVCAIVYIGLTGYALAALAGSMNWAARDAAQLVLGALALGYIAVVIAKQYADFAFRPYR